MQTSRQFHTIPGLDLCFLLMLFFLLGNVVEIAVSYVLLWLQRVKKNISKSELISSLLERKRREVSTAIPSLL